MKNLCCLIIVSAVFFSNLINAQTLKACDKTNHNPFQNETNVPKLKAIASSNQGNRHGPDKAVDGDLDTRWSSKFSDPEWLEIDIGKTIEIVGVTLFWETAYGKSYETLISGDRQSWVGVKGPLYPFIFDPQLKNIHPRYPRLCRGGKSNDAVMYHAR